MESPLGSGCGSGRRDEGPGQQGAPEARGTSCLLLMDDLAGCAGACIYAGGGRANTRRRAGKQTTGTQEVKKQVGQNKTGRWAFVTAGTTVSFGAEERLSGVYGCVCVEYVFGWHGVRIITTAERAKIESREVGWVLALRLKHFSADEF